MPLNQLFIVSKASKRMARVGVSRWITVPSTGSVLAKTVTEPSSNVTVLIASPAPHLIGRGR